MAFKSSMAFKLLLISSMVLTVSADNLTEYVYVNTSMGWAAAQAHCQNMGGGLAIIPNMTVNNQLQLMAAGAQYVWFGLHDQTQEGQWGYGSSSEPPVFTNWGPGEPSDSFGFENCAEMRIEWGGGSWRGKWNDGFCWTSIPFVCGPVDGTYGVVGSPCDSVDTVEGPCSRTYFSSSTNMNQINAKQWCRSNGGELAIIKSAADNAAAWAECGSRSCWIGLEEDSGYQGSWYWVDGTAPTYTNWQAGEPNNYGGTDEKYAIMNVELSLGSPIYSTGEWYDYFGGWALPVPLCSHCHCSTAPASTAAPSMMVAVVTALAYTMFN